MSDEKITPEAQEQLREIMRRLRANEISENYAYRRAIDIVTSGCANPKVTQ